MLGKTAGVYAFISYSVRRNFILCLQHPARNTGYAKFKQAD